MIDENCHGFIDETSDKLVHGFERENKYPFFGADRYFKETERLFPGEGWILVMNSGYYGYIGDGMEFDRGSKYLHLDEKIIGIVRQKDESLKDFEKRFRSESKARK